MNLGSLLQDLQDTDKRIAKLQREIDVVKALPSPQLEANKLGQVEAEKRARYQTLEQETQNLSAQEETTQKKAKKLHQRLYGGTVQNTKELRDMETDLKEANAKIDQLSEAILLNLEELDTLKTELADLQERVSKAQRNATQEAAHRQREIAHREEGIAKLREVRQQQEAALPQEAIYAYRNLFKCKGGIAVATVENNLCSVCRARMPEHKINEVRQNRLTYCETCGRILTLRIGRAAI